MIVAASHPIGRSLETVGAWMLGIIWMLPLLYAVWTAFHPAIYATHFNLLAPLTLANLRRHGRRRRSLVTCSTP